MERHLDSAGGAGCLACYMKALCISSGLSSRERQLMGQFVTSPVRLEKRQVLCIQHAPFNSLYAVRTGCLKQETTVAGAETLITALWLPGDIIGSDAIGLGHYPGTVTALEDSTLCRLPFERLMELTQDMPTLRKQIYSTISLANNEARVTLHQLLYRTAEARMAFFLLAVSACFHRRGYSAQQFRLPMSRADIGSYLGLTQETVGRVLATFQAQRLLHVQGREYQLIEPAELEKLASSTGRRQKR